MPQPLDYHSPKKRHRTISGPWILVVIVLTTTIICLAAEVVSLFQTAHMGGH